MWKKQEEKIPGKRVLWVKAHKQEGKHIVWEF